MKVALIRQQLRRADRTQGRRRGTGKERYLALVAEQRQRHCRADLGGLVSRREHEGSAHDVARRGHRSTRRATMTVAARRLDPIHSQ